MKSSFYWSHPWPPLFTVALVVAGVSLIVWSHRRQSIESQFTRWVLLALRISSFVLILFMLYQLAMQPVRAVSPDVVVCIDDSASMQTIDAYRGDQLRRVENLVRSSKLGSASRINQVKSLFHSDARAMRRWNSQYNVRFRSLSGPLAESKRSRRDGFGMTPLIELAAEQPESAIGDMLVAALRGQQGRPTAAIVLASDGISTKGAALQTAGAMARRKGIPIYTIAIGSERPSRDIELSAPLADPVAFVNDVVTVSCTVNAVGYDESDDNESIEVELTRAGEDQVIGIESVRLSDMPCAVKFTARPESEGDHEYVMRTSLFAGESQAANNEVSVTVDVRDERIRVLLVSSQPNYDYRFLKSLLDRESQREGATIEFDAFLQDGDPRLSAVDRSALPLFPASREQLLAYDVMILVNVDVGLLGASEKGNLRSTIVQAGRSCVLVFGGPDGALEAWCDDDTLSQLLPVRTPIAANVTPPNPHVVDEMLDEAYTIRLTDSGSSASNLNLTENREANRELWSQLPELYRQRHGFAMSSRSLVRGCRVLAELEAKVRPLQKREPAITLHYSGSGQVLIHHFSQAWRWRYRQADRLFGRYWLQTVRMLGRNKLRLDDTATIVCERESLREGEDIPLRVVLHRNFSADPNPSDGALTAVVELGGETIAERPFVQDEFSPQLFRVTMPPLPAGNYEIWLKSAGIEPNSVQCRVIVAAHPSEQTTLITNFDALEMLAEQSGGRAYTEKDAARLFRGLPEPKSQRAERLPPTAIWNRPWIAMLLISLLASEWLIRRSVGLP